MGMHVPDRGSVRREIAAPTTTGDCYRREHWGDDAYAPSHCTHLAESLKRLMVTVLGGEFVLRLFQGVPERRVCKSQIQVSMHGSGDGFSTVASEHPNIFRWSRTSARHRTAWKSKYPLLMSPRRAFHHAGMSITQPERSRPTKGVCQVDCFRLESPKPAL